MFQGVLSVLPGQQCPHGSTVLLVIGSTAMRRMKREKKKITRIQAAKMDRLVHSFLFMD